jgi:hypothetical protein
MAVFEVRMGISLWNQRYIQGWTAAFGFVTVPALESWGLSRCCADVLWTILRFPATASAALAMTLSFTECDGCHPFSQVVDLWPEFWEYSTVRLSGLKDPATKPSPFKPHDLIALRSSPNIQPLSLSPLRLAVASWTLTASPSQDRTETLLITIPIQPCSQTLIKR